MSIPILINNRDLLDSTRKQIEFFSGCKEAGPIILIDNASTYPPLVEWLGFNWGQSCSHPLGPNYARGREIDCLFLPENRGPRASLKALCYFKQYEGGYYFLSESDLDYTGVSTDFLLDLRERCRETGEACGISLRLDDLPASKTAEYAKSVEANNWRPIVYTHSVGGLPLATDDRDWYTAGCDMAGVMRPMWPSWDGGYGGQRSSVHTVRHLPWYFVPDDWECPVCRMSVTHSQRELAIAIGLRHGFKCSCETARLMPDDFRYYFQHASPAGTCYTAYQLDNTRAK